MDRLDMVCLLYLWLCHLICMFMKLSGYEVGVSYILKFMCNPISMIFAYFLRASRLSLFV